MALGGRTRRCVRVGLHLTVYPTCRTELTRVKHVIDRLVSLHRGRPDLHHVVLVVNVRRRRRKQQVQQRVRVPKAVFPS